MKTNTHRFEIIKKTVIYFLCTVLAVLGAVGVVYLLVNRCQKEFSSYTGSYISCEDKEDNIENVVETVEIVSEEIIIVTEDTLKNPTLAEIVEEIKALEQTEENIVVVRQSNIDPTGLSKRNVKLNVKCILQNPELPTGCEITSLTTVLNYYGYNVSKTTMSDDFLEKSNDEVADFWKMFLGNPRSEDGFGCYAQPIIDAANKYLKTQDNNYIAINYSGTQFEKLLKEVESGNPVIIWGTMYGEKENDLREPLETKKWEIDGKTIQWIAPEHCMVLIGYDIDRNVAIMSDPQRGIVEYNLETVKSRYIAMHSQCVILKKRNPSPKINGVKDGATYYTTQKVSVTDDNFKDVTVNGERSDNNFFINGNAENTYEIKAIDESGNITTVKIYTKPLNSIALPIKNLSVTNVTTDNSKEINFVRNFALSIDTQYAGENEKIVLKSIIDNCDTLLAKINFIADKYEQITTAVNVYNDKTPTEEDIALLNTLIADIDELCATDNLNEQQYSNLCSFKDVCNDLLLQIPQDNE